MSSGDNLEVAYCSALLAKAIKQEDGDRFTELYDQILKVLSADQVNETVSKARKLSTLPLPTLECRIKWMESHGAILPATEACVVVPTADEEPLEECTFGNSDASGTDNVHMKKTNCGETPNSQSFYDDVKNCQYIDFACGDIDSSPVESEVQSISVIAGCNDSLAPKTLVQTENVKIENSDLAKLSKYSSDCVISKRDQSYTVVDVEDVVDFGLLVSPASSNKAANFPPQIEMKEMKENKPINSLDSDECNADNSKKVKKKKKKKKSKAQGLSASTELDPTCMDLLPQHKSDPSDNLAVDEKSTATARNRRRKKLREVKVKGVSLECPEVKSKTTEDYKTVKHDVEKRPKRTVKSYQKERERLEQRSEENPETIKFASQNQFKTYGTLGSNQKVSVKRSEDVQPPVLDDETVNRILQHVGEDFQVNTSLPKRKPKEVKKEKKKIKRQNKSDKDRPKQIECGNSKEEKNHKNQPVELHSSIVDHSMQLYSGTFETRDEVPPSGDENDFITPKRSRRPVGRVGEASSGRSSPHSPSQRKRRFSDPSPSIHGNSCQSTNNDNNEAARYAAQTNFPATTNIFDRDQWPTLSSNLTVTSSQPCASTRCATSYASKLKTNLDSTGCSLASSSEDGASSSSSSSGGHNFQSNVAGRSSPSNELEEFLSAMPSVPKAAGIDLTKLTKSSSRCRNNTAVDVSSCASLNPADVVEVVQCLKVKDHANLAAIVATKTEPWDSETARSDGRPRAAENEPEASSDPVVTAKAALSDCSEERFEIKNALGSENTPQEKKTNKLRPAVDMVLPDGLDTLFENKWGLEFFTDPSVPITANHLLNLDVNCSTVSDANNSLSLDIAVSGIKETLKFSDGKLTFGDEDVSAQHPEQPNIASTVLEIPNTSGASGIAAKKYDMRMDSRGNIEPWNDPGYFNLNETAAFLQSEFIAASGKARHYQEE